MERGDEQLERRVVKKIRHPLCFFFFLLDLTALGQDTRSRRENMNIWAIVWILWAMALFYGSCQAGDEGERRGGRKRNRGTGSTSPGVSAFRPDPSSRNLPLPVDPLFTDQREIRLTFMKVQFIHSFQLLWTPSITTTDY